LGGLGRELAVEETARDGLIVVAHRRAFEPLPHPRLQLEHSATMKRVMA
jgi:hypothetical protein